MLQAQETRLKVDVRFPGLDLARSGVAVKVSQWVYVAHDSAEQKGSFGFRDTG